jgi:hypothetical protein
MPYDGYRTPSPAVLARLSAGITTTGFGLSQAETFRTEAESVDGLRTISTSFPAGVVSPVVIMTNPTDAEAVAALLALAVLRADLADADAPELTVALDRDFLADQVERRQQGGDGEQRLVADRARRLARDPGGLTSAIYNEVMQFFVIMIGMTAATSATVIPPRAFACSGCSTTTRTSRAASLTTSGRATST